MSEQAVTSWDDFARYATEPRGAGTTPTLAALRERRSEIVAIVERHRGSNVRVFGSVARGDAGPGSDVDLLVDLAPEATLLDLGGMYTDIGDLLDRELDIVYFHEETSPAFRARVEREAVPL